MIASGRTAWLVVPPQIAGVKQAKR